MEKAFKVAVLFASPDFGGDGGGVVITPHGVHRIPPWTPEMREVIVQTVSLYEAMREPGCWPGPPPPQYGEVMYLSAHLLTKLSAALVGDESGFETSPTTVVIVVRDYRTGNVLLVIDGDGHVHHGGGGDPRATDLASAALIFVQATQLRDRGMMHDIQEVVTPSLKARAADFSRMLVPA